MGRVNEASMKRELVQCVECEYCDAANGGYPAGEAGVCRFGPLQLAKRRSDGCYSGCRKPFGGVLKNHPNYAETTSGRSED